MSNKPSIVIGDEYLLSEIFSYLQHRRDILNVSLVSRAWHDTALPMLYHRISLPIQAGHTLKLLLHTLERNKKLCKHITFLEIRAYPCDILAEERRITASRLVYVLKHCRNLSDFVLLSQFALTSAMRNTLFKLPHLRRLVINASEAIKLRPLDLWEIPFTVKDIGLVISERPFVNILPEFLRRTRPAPPPDKPYENALRSLSLYCGGSYNLTNEILAEMFYERVSSQLEYLRSLRIVGARGLTAEGVARVIAHLHHLTSLSLEELNIEPAEITLITEKLSYSLTSFRVSHDASSFEVSDVGFAAGIAYVLCRCVRLNSLVVYRKSPMFALGYRRGPGGKRTSASYFPTFDYMEFFSLLGEAEKIHQQFREGTTPRENIIHYDFDEQYMTPTMLFSGIHPTEWLMGTLSRMNLPVYARLTKLYITGLTIPLRVLPFIHRMFPNVSDLALHFEHDSAPLMDGLALPGSRQEDTKFPFTELNSMLRPFSKLVTLHLRFPDEAVTFGQLLDVALAIEQPSCLAHIGTCNRLLKLYREETKEQYPPSVLKDHDVKGYFINRGASLKPSATDFDIKMPYTVRRKADGTLMLYYLCEWDEAEWPEIRHLLST